MFINILAWGLQVKNIYNVQADKGLNYQSNDLIALYLDSRCQSFTAWQEGFWQHGPVVGSASRYNDLFYGAVYISAKSKFVSTPQIARITVTSFKLHESR